MQVLICLASNKMVHDHRADKPSYDLVATTNPRMYHSTTMNDTHGLKSVLDEIASVRTNLPDINIQTATIHFCTAIYSKLPNRRIKLTFTFPDKYPCDQLIVDVAAERGVPQGLKKKLEKELGQTAALNKGTYNQVEPVLAKLKDFVDTNKFVSCWRELRQVVNAVQKLNQVDDSKKSTITLNDVKGLIKIKLWNGNYYYFCSITVDDAYPTTASNHDWGKACWLIRDKTNFPPKIEQMLTAQGQEFVRRMQDGMSADKALIWSNPVQLPKGMEKHFAGDSNYPREKLSQENKVTPKGNAERKSSRRETERELPTMEQMDWQVREKSRIEGYNISSFDGTDPQPSFLPLVTFLVTKVQQLPQEICPICKDLTLPNNPNVLSSFYIPILPISSNAEKRVHQMAQQRRPVYTHCGCWYHYTCLHVFMTQPPFGATCPVHDVQVYHPDWPEERDITERRWAMKQAREREIADAALAFM